jgi:bacterioferritin (cytochrome b1)
MIQHLVNIGVPSDAVFGDMFSWDSVTNGYSLRMFIDGILLYRDILIAENLPVNQPQNAPQMKEKEGTKLIEKLQVEVFISDFHAERIKESFLFLLNLAPSMTDRVQLNINIVDSQGIKWKSAEEFNQRIKHEEIATEKLRETRKQITTVQQYHAFVMLGGHLGLNKYLHGAYVKSQGVGW